MTDENPNLPDNEEEIGNSDQAEATMRNIDQVKAPLSNCPNNQNGRNTHLDRMAKRFVIFSENGLRNTLGSVFN